MEATPPGISFTESHEISIGLTGWFWMPQIVASCKSYVPGPHILEAAWM